MLLQRVFSDRVSVRGYPNHKIGEMKAIISVYVMALSLKVVLMATHCCDAKVDYVSH